jgi:hypothetical protein
LKKSFVVVLLGLAWAAACGNASSSSTSAIGPLATGSSAIQGGTDDTTHNFAIGIFIMDASAQTSAICSGVLLAPNLVATARHCVSKIGAPDIDCQTSAFAATLPAGDILVTAKPTMTMTSSDYIGVSSIHVPPQTSFCGNDIALLILSKSIDVPQYVTPTIDPPMTDHQLYSTAVTAIGYGIDTPLDEAGISAGTRRIKENNNLVCIPNDTSFANCLSDPTWLQFATVQEFEGGDGTCDGDSGSGAYDQASFNKGQWVAFGVLSRGGLSSDGGSCVGSFYSRFDAWGSLLVDAANEAAAMGGYAPPSWAASSSQQPTGMPGECFTNGTACLQDSDCCSVNCISHDNNVTSFCTACDANNPCNTGFGCQSGLCVALATSIGDADSGSAAQGASATHGGGCMVGAIGSESSLPWSRAGAYVAFAALVVARRKRRRSAHTLRLSYRTSIRDRRPMGAVG